MQIFKSWMQKKPSVKTVAFWNMMGSLVNAAVSVLNDAHGRHV